MIDFITIEKPDVEQHRRLTDGPPMRVHLYSICWNEVTMLDHFFEHYDSWVDRFVIYDDGSTDGSIDRLRAHPKVELRTFERVVDDSFVLSHQKLQNDVWRESKNTADWVIITALDEFLQVKNWDNHLYLRRCLEQGVTLIPALGFQMVSDRFPDRNEDLLKQCRWGAPYHMMNKLSIFNPDALSETNFSVGRHDAKPEGILKAPAIDEMMLLHYKYLGYDRTFHRQNSLGARLGALDNSKRWGFEYHWKQDEFQRSWDSFKRSAVDIGDDDFVPASAHDRTSLWWRKNRT
jgi:hypothetical protein